MHALGFWTTPVDDEPIVDLPNAMETSAALNFDDSDPTRALEWMRSCLETPGPKERPDDLRLGRARYKCTGAANAPGYAIFW